MQDLRKLLTALITNKPDDPGKLFDEIAVCLLRQAKIVTTGDQFHFKEIEFYYHNKDNHPDPYVHQRPRQADFGEWYFHRFTKVDTFQKNNRNGIDLSFGNKEAGIFGGILIRKIQNIDTGELIVGINKVVKKLIGNAGIENIKELALGTGSKAFDKQQPMHLEVDGNSHADPIYKTQRHGLSYKADEISQYYFKQPYCYYNHKLNLPQIIQVR